MPAYSSSLTRANTARTPKDGIKIHAAVGFAVVEILLIVAPLICGGGWSLFSNAGLSVLSISLSISRSRWQEVKSPSTGPAETYTFWLILQKVYKTHCSRSLTKKF